VSFYEQEDAKFTAKTKNNPSLNKFSRKHFNTRFRSQCGSLQDSGNLNTMNWSSRMFAISYGDFESVTCNLVNEVRSGEKMTVQV
jgi:hypothetical protein